MIMSKYTVVLALLVIPILLPLTAPTQDTPAKLETLSEEAYQAVVQFYQYDKTIPLEARMVERRERDDYAREKVVFRGVRGFLVPAFLELPKTGQAPFSCILLLHGWSGAKLNWWEDDNFIYGGLARKALLEAGYAVFALDAQAHGERCAEIDYAHVNYSEKDGWKNYFTLPEIYTQTTTDYRRGLDYLATRPEINMERLGVLGYSMGGTQSFLLTSVDSRIRVTVACVTPAMTEKYYPVAPKNYVRGLAGRPFLMLMGRTDEMCSVDLAKQLYDLIPSEQKDLKFFEAGHKLPKEYIEDVVAWFNKYL